MEYEAPYVEQLVEEGRAFRNRGIGDGVVGAKTGSLTGQGINE